MIKLDGRIALEVAFGEQVMKSMIYVKMDASEQLLLSEGICRQLGIVTYHSEVKPCAEAARAPVTIVQVPVVRVQLLKSVSIPPQGSIHTTAKAIGEMDSQEVWMLEPNPDLESEGLKVMPTLCSQDVSVVLTNPSGFTCQLEKGCEVGTMEAVQPVSAANPQGDLPPSSSGEGAPEARVWGIRSPAATEARKQALSTACQEYSDLPAEAKDHLLGLLREYHECFCLEENERGETELVQFEIDTGDAPPRRQRPRRMPFTVREEVSRQLHNMQEAGVIRASRSPWASPVVLVRKRDGSHRFCVDYRELNAVTKPDTFPLPRIDDLLDQLGSAQYFSTLDLAAGYWQIQMHPASQHLLPTRACMSSESCLLA